MAQPQANSAAALQALYSQGLALHQAGRLQDAALLYQQVLAADPSHHDALHLLGVVCLQTGQTALGVQFIEHAVRLQPGLVQAHGNLANGLNSLGRYDEALASSERAIALAPDFAEAHGNRALALYQLSGAAAALPSYERVVALQPSGKAWFNQGAMLRDLGRFEEALACFDQAMALDPDYAEAHRSRGLVLRELGRPQEALTAYDQAIALKPDYSEALNNRGNVLTDLQRHAEALDDYARATALKPDYAEAYSNQAVALRGLRRPEEALAACDRAIALEPDYAEAHNNRAGVLFELQRLDEALESCARTLALKPDFAAAYNNQGVVLHQLRRLDEAVASFDRAIALTPHDAEAHYNQAMVRLTLGDSERGWAQYEHRWGTAQFSGMARGLTAPLWLGGQDLNGCTILLHAEQGLGDTLQFCRYVPEFAVRGARVIFEVQPGLERLLARLSGVERIVVRGEPLPDHDLQTPLMSLPLALKAAPSACASPYLSADPDDAAAWAQRLASFDGLKVGLCWAGGARPDQPIAHGIDLRRSLDLPAFTPLAGLEGMRVFSLQKGPPAAQLGALEGRWPGPPIMDFTHDLHDVADTAALVANLDLVITCDTAMAHLAGGLGTPVWILNRFDACWRWLDGRDDSPWYPSARLFRQKRPGDWDQVIEEVRRDVAFRTGRMSHTSGAA